MILSYDSWIIITCKRKLSSHQTNLDNTFTLYPALEDGYFSDLEIRASNGQTVSYIHPIWSRVEFHHKLFFQFQVHKTVIALNLPESEIESLNGLPESVLSTILHFFYSHHLPATLSSATAKLCIEHLREQSSMSRLIESCQCFLKDTALRNEIQNLVKNIHTSLERMVHLFDSSSESDMLVNAARLWQSVKLCSGYGNINLFQFFCYSSINFFFWSREAVMVVVRFIQLCVTYLKHKNELTADERKEMLSYFHSRLPIFVSQVYRLLKYFKNVIGGLSASQNFVLASYIAPEVHKFVKLLLHDWTNLLSFHGFGQCRLMVLYLSFGP